MVIQRTIADVFFWTALASLATAQAVAIAYAVMRVRAGEIYTWKTGGADVAPLIAMGIIVLCFRYAGLPPERLGTLVLVVLAVAVRIVLRYGSFRRFTSG